MSTASKYAEETKANENVEILDGPVAFSDDSGRVQGTAQIERVALLDYKTKQPTGDKIVNLTIHPSAGRKVSVRLKHAVAALTALGFIDGDDDDEGGQ